ncbi:MAG: hypothetical protein RSD22_04730 [Romboutsia sp.]
MFQIINWICLVSICFLVGEIMVYFCKDAINILNGIEVKRSINVGKTRLDKTNYCFKNKIAK